MNEKVAYKAVESRDIALAAWANAAGAVRQLLDDGVDPTLLLAKAHRCEGLISPRCSSRRATETPND